MSALLIIGLVLMAVGLGLIGGGVLIGRLEAVQARRAELARRLHLEAHL
jgi:hypothetical protein